MAELNCQMHVKTSTDYDDIFLTSKSELVEYDNTISGLSATNTKGAIDELASEKLDKVGDAKDTTVTFTEAVTLANVNSGESQATLWGKVKKMFSFIGTDITKLASAYSASNTYGVGAYVTQSNKLYRCTTAITVAEAFNVAKWTESNFSEWSGLKVSSPVTLGANLTQNQLILEKIGKVVYLSFQLTATNTIASNSTLITIPVGYRIVGNPYVMARIGNVPNAVSTLQVQGGGNVILADTALASGSQIIFNISYFTT